MHLAISTSLTLSSNVMDNENNTKIRLIKEKQKQKRL